MARTLNSHNDLTPVVDAEAGYLLNLNDNGRKIKLDSDAWRNWIDTRTPRYGHHTQEQAGRTRNRRTFYYRDAAHSMTCILQKRRDRWFWYGYKVVDGRTRNVYLGKSEKLYDVEYLARKADGL